MTLKKLTKSILLKMGLDVRLAPKQPPSNSGLVETVIAGFPILVPGDTHLRDWFRDHPNYLGQLQRVCRMLHKEWPDLVAVDVGANVGDSLALIKAGADVPVICIEGDQKVLALTRQNVKQFSRTQLVESFVAEKDGDGAVAITKEGWNATLGLPSQDGATVRFRTLDGILTEAGGFPAHGLLKIDVEGYEPKVVAGANKFLASTQPIVVLEYNEEALRETGQDGPEMLKQLAAAGYGPCLWYESDGAYLTAGELGDPVSRQEIVRYCKCPYRAALYLDLIIFPEAFRDVFERFRSAEAG